jgi:hypothetical protein
MTFHALNPNEMRSMDHGRQRKAPFEHQLDAFERMSSTFELNGKRGKGALLVLPTGTGKTFAAVKWLCDQVIRRDITILWLAYSFYLLDQACKEFFAYASWLPEPRETLNLRAMSSNPSHDSPADIQPTDDVVIMTTQTALKNLHIEALDRMGTPLLSPFRRFVGDGTDAGFCVVCSALPETRAREIPDQRYAVFRLPALRSKPRRMVKGVWITHATVSYLSYRQIRAVPSDTIAKEAVRPNTALPRNGATYYGL